MIVIFIVIQLRIQKSLKFLFSCLCIIFLVRQQRQPKEIRKKSKDLPDKKGTMLKKYKRNEEFPSRGNYLDYRTQNDTAAYTWHKIVQANEHSAKYVS